MDLYLFKDVGYRVDDSLQSDSGIVYHCGDALPFLRGLPRNLAKLIITSPPYNIGKDYEQKESIEEYLAQQELIINELKHILSDSGSICWQVGNYVNKGEVFPLDIYYYNIFKSLGLKLRNRIIWHFGHGLHAQKRFSGRYETILWFTKGDTYTFNLDEVRIPSKYPGKKHYKGSKKGMLSGNPMGKNPSDFWTSLSAEWDEGVWEIPNVKSNHPEKTIHPCQFPVELVERCVLALTDQNDWVLDPFAGVGSSAIASIKNNRRCIAIDKEQNYVDVGIERIHQYYSGALKLRPLGKPVYQPPVSAKDPQTSIDWGVSSTSKGGRS